MLKRLGYILALLAVVALVFYLCRTPSPEGWHRGDPELVVVTPHNEAIRHEFGHAFAAWHQHRYGRPVRVDWRVLDDTTEINRYIQTQYATAVRTWWRASQHVWPSDMGDQLFDTSLDVPLAQLSGSKRLYADIRHAFVQTDSPTAFTSGVDLFWGGGAFDHGEAARRGFTVSLEKLLPSVVNPELLPQEMNGEIWRTTHFLGTALSACGICYNQDRLHDLGMVPPTQWEDLSKPAYFGRLSLTDPTASASIAKAFDLIIQQQCRNALHGADFSDDDIRMLENIIATSPAPQHAVPQGVPLVYQRAIENGWQRGLALIQLLCANTRHFTDAAGRIPIEVDRGDSLAGIGTDYDTRFQAAHEPRPGTRSRLAFIVPVGGSSVSCDPISLLRGAEHREIAERFMAFVLSPEGQRLWCYRVGVPGGPKQSALWCLPIRRDFYPMEQPAAQQVFQQHRTASVFDLADPLINAYQLASNFTYVARWTGRRYGLQRDLIKVMCMDAGDELRTAWAAILAHGGPVAQPEAMKRLQQLPTQPEPLTWASAVDMERRCDRRVYLQQWLECFRRNYRMAEEIALKHHP